ncbi:MAG TPA: DUF4382 domain-containing protein, partial [Gammaproteobacteria bacterium]|nr:DUF4382 domain-containing protein [Gammaproteobacteria bacterium]
MKYTLVRLLIALMAALWLGACQHDSDSTADTESGELSIELTDAKGDFTNYTVDLLSLSLTKKNGSIVEVLPESTRIDFSQYVEMSELLTLATVPEGIYTAATLRLDYQDAEIYVEDAEGNSVKVDSIVDEDGNEVGKLESKVTLEGRDQLSIVPGVPAHLSLDFDLKTSNVVTFDEETEIPGITVSPSLHASLEPAQDKTHRIRGPLKNVNVDSASFELFLRPFNHKINNNQGRFGSVKILTDENTRFEIDGESSVGADGIAIMDETLDKLAAVIVVGDISLNPRRFTATEVYAGSSVPGGTLDVVRGTVLSRTGETLVVHGATLIRAGGSILFNDKVNVLLGADTTVVKREKDDGAYSIADISVGQAVTIFGSLDDDTANLVLDATAGNVRMRITSLLGTVVDPAELTENDAPFELDLATINGRKTALFDFSGTGRDAKNDADPAFYEIDTGNL